MKEDINTKKIIENMERKNIKVVSIDTDNMLYMCDDGNEYPLMDRLLTIKETGKLLNVSKQTLQRWDNSGKLIAVRTEGGHRRYKLSDIEKILGENDNLSSDTKKEIIDKTTEVFVEILIELCPELLGYGAAAKKLENEFRKRLENKL